MSSSLWTLITTLESQLDNQGAIHEAFATLEKLKYEYLTQENNSDVGMEIPEWFVSLAVLVPVFVTGVIVGVLLW